MSADKKDAVVAAARALVARIEEVSAHDDYYRVWQTAQGHNGPYAGPKYTDAFDALVAALGEVKP